MRIDFQNSYFHRYKPNSHVIPTAEVTTKKVLRFLWPLGNESARRCGSRYTNMIDLIHTCIQTPHLMTDGTWAKTCEILHYRMQAVETAEKLARRMGFQAPKASRWNMDDWLSKNVGTENYKQASQYYSTDRSFYQGCPPQKKGRANHTTFQCGHSHWFHLTTSRHMA